ncbi:hypothetical protein EV652_102312 [Kribbella steppae]|uniref:Uncharacterized protein n=1 Tax=Kribbella steppae TaxID=2512223 RepID=A0A4R2HTB9_9ACTN|nr:hypothetical protein EV652_102312 [Kribbella steppae]
MRPKTSVVQPRMRPAMELRAVRAKIWVGMWGGVGWSPGPPLRDWLKGYG